MLRMVVAIGLLVQVIAFGGFGFLLLLNVTQTSAMVDTLVIEFAASFKERDVRLHQLHSRLLVVEEQRDLERRLTEQEKALRTYCISDKLSMCGQLGPVEK